MHGLVSRIAVGVFGLMTVAMILLAIFDDRGALAVRERRLKRDELKAQVTTIQKQNEEYRKEIEALRSDPATIEKRAREKLKLVKPDEIILQLPEEATPATKEQEPPAAK
jgi:cell division protein FtsB